MEITFTYLSVTFKGVAKSPQDVFRKIAFWQSLPKKCDACGGTDLKFDHRTPQEYEFYSIGCCKCGAEFKVHERKDNKGMYVAAEDKFEKFSGEEKRSSEGNQSQPAANDDGDEDF